jgi:hypothetical protein
MRVAKDSERLTFERVLVPRDFDVIRQLLEMGSVSCFPSIGSTTTD